MKEQITMAQIQAGDLIDGGRIGIPEYYRINHIAEASGATYVREHAAVDYGRKAVRRKVGLINGRVKRFAAEAARRGCYLVIHWGGLSNMPQGYAMPTREMNVTIWAVRPQEQGYGQVVLEFAANEFGILWPDSLTSIGKKTLTSMSWRRVDAMWRHLERRRSAMAQAA